MLSDEVLLLNKEISRTVARASNAEKGKFLLISHQYTFMYLVLQNTLNTFIYL